MTTVAEPTNKRPRLPEWFRLQLPTASAYFATRNLIDDLNLNTVCESAKCPNHWECWSQGTATFMIAGDRCTRACGFCAVNTAKPLPLRMASSTSNNPARRAPCNQCCSADTWPSRSPSDQARFWMRSASAPPLAWARRLASLSSSGPACSSRKRMVSLSQRRCSRLGVGVLSGLTRCSIAEWKPEHNRSGRYMAPRCMRVLLRPVQLVCRQRAAACIDHQPLNA